MNKDVNFWKVIVSKFLDKLGNVEMKDADILPALEDYAQTGKRKMFEEYSKFHYAMELKERENFLKKMIERSEKNNSALEKKLEDDKAYADKVYKDFKEYMEKYKSFFNEYKVWRDDIMKELDSDETTITQGWGTLTKLIEENGSVNPEFKESEDEKIRKDIRQCIKLCRFVPSNGTTKDEMFAWLKKQKDMSSTEYVFRPLAGCDIESAATQALEQQRLGYNTVLAFNGAYIPVEEKTTNEIVEEYYSWCEKQGAHKSVMSEDALREGIAHFGITQYQIDNWLKKYVDVEKQDEHEELKNIEQKKDMYNKLTDFETSLKHIMEEAIECGDTHNLKADADMLLRLAQKSADNSELKFQTGDWITNSIETVQITGYDIDYGYQVDCKGSLLHRDTDIIEKEYHLWTIQDAKDGDVLASDNSIFIFQEEYIAEKPIAYCGLMNGIFIKGGDACWTNEKYHPATKEQRELLFKKMAENGYAWDAEKKECRVIPKFKVGDWVVFNGFVLHIDEIVDGYYRTTTIGGIPNSYDWNIDNAARLWTIKDAKDGDVLVYHNSLTEIIMLFKSWVAYRAAAYTHFHIFDNDYRVNNFCDCGDGAHLATKEQRELLFRKMKEKGYEWNEEKKECREIPKLKVGDWIVTNTNNSVYRITEIPEEYKLKAEGQYRLYSYEDNTISYCWKDDLKDKCHLWTIEDAKDGDVLYSPCCKLLWIYKDEKTCYVGSNLNYNSGSIVINKSVCIPTDVIPATKEQRELLFKKMAENGYAWDTEKKELSHQEVTKKSDKVGWSDEDQDY